MHGALGEAKGNCGYGAALAMVFCCSHLLFQFPTHCFFFPNLLASQSCMTFASGIGMGIGIGIYLHGIGTGHHGCVIFAHCRGADTGVVLRDGAAQVLVVVKMPCR